MRINGQTLAYASLITVTLLLTGSTLGYYLGTNQQSTIDKPTIDNLSQINENLLNQISNLTTENDALRKAQSSIAGKTIRLGYIAPETHTYNTAKLFIEKIIKPDLDAYVNSLGLNISFEFEMMNADSLPSKHLELVQKLHEDGVNILIGAGWSSMCCASLSYENSNHMLVVSPSATSPTCAIANDSMFRMCPADFYQAPAMAHIIWSYGIREVVVLYRGDSYGDSFVNLFVPEFTNLGGVASQPVRYNASSPLEAEVDYCPSLQIGRDRAQGAIARLGGDSSKVAVLLVALDEAAKVIKTASQCDVLYNLVWFNADLQTTYPSVIADSPLEANHIKLLTPEPKQPDTLEYARLRTRYENVAGEIFEIYDAYMYDAAFALARTIIETDSYNATTVARALSTVCSSTYGITGSLRLNEYGDRVPPILEIWYYVPGVTQPSVTQMCGFYDPDTTLTTWRITTVDEVS